MQLNLSVWLSALNHFTQSSFLEGCALLFPLVDKAAKARRPKGRNRDRMVAYFTDELEHVIALGTGLDLKFNPSGSKIDFGGKSVGEVMYAVRCEVLHEAQFPLRIEFVDGAGSFAFGQDHFECLLVVVLASPEFTSVPKEFLGRAVRFARHKIVPSQCVGSWGETRTQLLFGAQ
jgi:hypothetical protein